MVGLDGIFLVHVLLTVGPACSGIDVRLLEDPKLNTKNDSGCTTSRKSLSNVEVYQCAFLEKEADLIAVEHRQEHGFNRPSWVEGHTALARLGCEAQARQ